MILKDLEYLNPKSVLDIGANVGSFSQECKQIWPECKIFMIEGNPVCDGALEGTGLPYAISLLSDTKKTVTFHQRSCGGTSTGDSIYLEDTPWYEGENLVTTEMETSTLDSIIDNQFDLIKIDVQGAELDILRGGSNVVSGAKYILMEIPAQDAKPYNIGSPTYEEVIEYMDSMGFTKREELGDIVHPIERHIIQQDILFSRA